MARVRNYSEKSLLAVVLFCFLLGAFGVHRFYVGKIGSGILMVVTLGGVGVWWLADMILIAIGEFSDKDGKFLRRGGATG